MSMSSMTRGRGAAQRGAGLTPREDVLSWTQNGREGPSRREDTMNLQDLHEELTEAIAACEREGIDPSTVGVRGVIQPSYPIYNGITNVGFVRDAGEHAPWLALAADGDDGYANEAVFHADLEIPGTDEECEECEWQPVHGDCVNPECSRSFM